ncbi:DUF2268 domain-containing protein [Thermoactinospora rubra]|uniref:DUF2268 domain-containing protein n=1 Tax=Thermoactinospora rubra TaxID=1088767 RepID=UPI000A120F45|nr:DUF2268 domain-containing putative Zn-dependent protease [Thermoactinospora rubra]
MDIVIHDTLPAMERMLQGPVEKRPEALRAMLAPMREAIPMPGDLVDMHHQGGGFRVDREDERYLPALRWLAETDLPGQIERLLKLSLGYLRDAVPGLRHPETLQVMFVLGDPDNEHLMRTTGGYYGMGSAPGWLYLLAWPTEENVGRIAHCAVHEFHHQVRYSNVAWDPATVTVGEHVVAEGLAEAFVRELSGPEAMGPWSAMVTGADFERAYEKIVADIDLQGMQHTPAYVLGDSAMARFGGTPRGIPDMAGYAVGLRLVEAHLAATGMSVAASTVLPAAQILAPALEGALDGQRGRTKPDS